MEQRDWELLNKQVRGLRPSRNDDVIALTVVASELMRIASNDARIAISLPNGAAPTAWR